MKSKKRWVNKNIFHALFGSQAYKKVSISRGNVPNFNRFPRLIDTFLYLCIGFETIIKEEIC